MIITSEFVEKIDPCDGGREWFVENNMYWKDGIEVVKKLIEQGHLSEANWLIVRTMEYKQYVSYAVFAAKQVIDIYEKKYPNCYRPRKAIEAAKKCIENPSKENKNDAAAYAAAADAYAAAAYAADAYAAAVDAADAADAYAAAAAAAADAAAYAAAAAAAAADAVDAYAAAAADAYAADAAYAAYATADAAAAAYATDAAAAAAADAYAADAAAAAYAKKEMQLKILNYGIELLKGDL